MDPFAEIVDVWLMEDALRPKKERRTALKIYEELKKNYGYQGSSRTARGFVTERKRALKIESEKFLEIEHPSGVAQADFGTTSVIMDGVIRDVSVLVLSFPYSNAGFFYPLPAENQECFFHGLSEIFRYIDGVPSKITFDNLTAAVIMKGGTRHLTEDFLRFKNHYRFEAVFCAPAKGNEKGNVENKVGYSRRNFLLPFPEITDFEDLRELLYEKAWKDLKREHYLKNAFLSELWEEDAKRILPLPATPFQYDELSTAKVNKTCNIRFNNEAYYLPCANVGQEVVIKSTWDKLDIYDRDGKHLRTLERKYTGKTEPIDWVSIFEIFIQKPRAVKEATMFKFLPDSIRHYLNSCPPEDFKRVLKLFFALLKEKFLIEDIAQAIEHLGENAYNESLLRHVLYRQIAKPDLATLNEKYTPKSLESYNPQLKDYDQLLYTEGGENSDLHPRTV